MALLAVVTVKIVTNYLSVEGYGEYALIYEFLAFFSIAADMGLFTIAVREMSKDEKDIPKILGNVLTLRTILIVVMMVVATVTVFLIPKYEDTRIPLGVAIATLSVFFTILNGTVTSVLQTKLKMHISSLAQISSKVIQVAYMLYVVLVAFPKTGGADPIQGFYHLLIAGVIGNLVMLFITQHFVSKIAPIRYQLDKKLCKDVFLKALPYGIALILNTVYFRIDSILISLIRGQAEVGIYAVAMRVLEAFAIIPLYFMNSVLPVLTKSLKEKTDQYKLIIAYSFDFLAALGLPLLVGAYVLAYPIVFIVSSPEFLTRFNEGFYGSDTALKILMFALVFQFLNTLFAFVLLAVNKQSKILYINAACVLFNIIGNLIVIPHYGFRGAAVTSVLSELLILILTAATAYHYLKYKINLVTTLKITISALLMGVAVHYLQPVSYALLENAGVLLLVPVGALIYGLLLIATKAVDKEMLKLLLRK
jgi:O-antigen/teichoic acid export membrane protein